MPTPILVAYASSYGSTQEVAEAVAATLREAGQEVDLQPLRDVRRLTGYAAVVMGAPLIMFHWHKDAMHFLSRHKETLSLLPVAVFALGPVHAPHDDQEWQDSHDQLAKELARFPWFHPVTVTMFGGRYDPEKLRFPLKQMAGKEPPSDLRDWDAIRQWAGSLPVQLNE